MALSLKGIADSCLGLSPEISVVRDVFGYSAPRLEMSIARQLELVRGQALGLNVVLVGVENFSDGDIVETESAIQWTRDLYSKVSIGIRELRWSQISVADAGSYVTIDSKSEAGDLTDDWNSLHGGDRIDLFVVRTMNNADGVAPVGGPCAQDHKKMTGAVVSLNGDFDNSGNTFAHEIGHYLDLDHVSSSTNFIGNNGNSNSNTGITNSQGNKMKGHCRVRDKC